MRRTGGGSAHADLGRPVWHRLGPNACVVSRRDGWKRPSVFRQESAAAIVAMKPRQRGMEPRAKRKNKDEPVTTAKATKPNGGADGCLATGTSALKVNLMAQVLEPLFDPEFSDRSYGFRKRRGAHDAVQQARAYLKEGIR